MAVADRLGRLPSEIMAMPVTDLVDLLAYYKLKPTLSNKPG